MRRVWLGLVCLTVAGLAGWLPAAAQARDNVEDARALAKLIDKHTGAKWIKNKVTPAPLSGDAEFFRRISLDLQGRIPGLTEIRDFIDDDRADKRWIWIDEMLKEPVSQKDPHPYANHFANVFRHLLLPQTNADQRQFFSSRMENWLRARLRSNVGYHKIVRELITAPLASQNNDSPSVFYQANEFKPDNLAASTSRLFLGHKLECAQCHDHPFAKWTRKQFWEYTAFFAGINQGGGEQPNVHEISYKTGTTTKVAEARFLDGTQPDWADGASARTVLARWITRADNPFFARATVNKVWTYFFGNGLIDPVDEESDENPPSHPELLNDLAREFAAHDFDLKFLIRGIVNSRTFQLTSRMTHPSQKDPRLLGRMPVRGLTPEQLFDSVAMVIDYKDSSVPNQGFNNYNLNTPRAQFLARFDSQEKSSEMQTSILQALFMMNGKFMADAVSLKYNKNLEHIATARETGLQSVPLPKKIDQIYLIALSRLPTAKESARLVKYVKGGGKSGDPKKAFEDIFWALLNSGEFRMNH